MTVVGEAPRSSRSGDGARRRSARLYERFGHPIRGYTVAMVGEPDAIVCRDVRGFREALLAAFDPRASMPPQLGLVRREGEAARWLTDWAEDVLRVRRTLTIRRLYDARVVTVVATLASYGSGVDTSLGLESIATAHEGMSVVTFRSGVRAVTPTARAGKASAPTGHPHGPTLAHD